MPRSSKRGSPAEEQEKVIWQLTGPAGAEPSGSSSHWAWEISNRKKDPLGVTRKQNLASFLDTLAEGVALTPPVPAPRHEERNRYFSLAIAGALAPQVR